MVEALLTLPSNQKAHAGIGNEPKPFLVLLQNVLDTVTRAANVVSTQGEQVACEVLLHDLRSICQGQSIYHRMGSPVAQVTVDGSTPHTVSTLSSGPIEARSVQSAQSVFSAQSAQSASSSRATNTPAQASSLSAALLGAVNTIPTDWLDPRSFSVAAQDTATAHSNAVSSAGAFKRPQVDGAGSGMSALETISEETVLSALVPATVSASAQPTVSHTPSVVTDTAQVLHGTPAQEAALLLSPNPSTSARTSAASSSSQKKHARVIEAATISATATATTIANATSSAPHPMHRNKNSKGYIALQAYLKTHFQAQKHSQLQAQQSQSHSLESGSEDAADEPFLHQRPAAPSSSSKGVAARLAPSSRSAGSTNPSASIGDVGLGSPRPTRKGQPSSSSSATRAPASTTQLSSTSSIAQGSSYTTTTSASTSSSAHASGGTSASAAPGSHSTLRLLLRAENEKRRKTLPQTLPRFRSATSAHLAQLEVQEQQPEQLTFQERADRRKGRHHRAAML